ncbi:halocyanin domain-containing protein [Halopenitus malekzadehii]|uniref:Halocyanin domain-containing protein n=1 Tax=Halopenitus malekzadehii TaxID=1267564 RepID=A0A1H6I554_9EURY|nr:halocyanin domain-containing protein [Halopenitus malekzadehii]SEH41517.1 halocyanin domain-containing protein [Halopenitus malekzadehii]
MARHHNRPSRRAVLAAVGSTALVFGSGCVGGGTDEAGGQSGTGGEDGTGGDDGSASGTDDWIASANNYDGVVDRTGESTVTVGVGAAGGLAFGPAAVRVSAGTEVVWDWTGEGGQHNVVEENGRFESDLYREAGSTFTHVFETAGTYRYICTPHQASGMRGAVEVVE